MVVGWMGRASGAAAECGIGDSASERVEALNRTAGGFYLQSDAMLRGGRVTKVAGQAASYSPDLGLAILGEETAQGSPAQAASSPRSLLRWSVAPLALAAVLAIGAPEAAQAQATMTTTSINCPGDLNPPTSFSATASTEPLSLYRRGLSVTVVPDARIDGGGDGRAIDLFGSLNHVVTIGDGAVLSGGGRAALYVSSRIFSPTDPTNIDRIVVVNDGTLLATGNTTRNNSAAFLRSRGGGITITGTGTFLSQGGAGNIGGPTIDARSTGYGPICIAGPLRITNNTAGAGIAASTVGGGISIDLKEGTIFAPGSSGISAGDTGGGDINIGLLSVVSSSGVNAVTSGGNIIIDNSFEGSGLNNGVTGGISAATNGTGNVLITTGRFSAARGSGIQAGAGDGSITIDSTLGEAIGREGYGIRASSGGSADINITTGDVIGGIGGVIVFAGTGEVMIDTTLGEVEAEQFGVAVAASGSGSVSIDTAAINAVQRDAISVLTSGGTVDINSSAGAVSGGRYGLRVSSRDGGNGAVSITTAGVTGSNGDGILVQFEDRTVAGGDISIDSSAGAVTGSQDGIEALTSGDADITVLVDQVTGGGAGIIASTGAGSISIELASTALVTGGSGAGIDARSTGGAISVTGNSGDIVGATDGIYTRSGGGAILIDNLDSVTGNAGDGLDLGSAGGDITVNAVDTITGTGGNGIIANAGSGNISIQGSGTVGGISGTRAGISARAGGDISIGNVTTNGDISGVDWFGIDAESANGNITINTTGSAVTGLGTGISAEAIGASGAITITTGDVSFTPRFGGGYAVYARANGGGITIDTTAGTLNVNGIGTGVWAREQGGGDISITTGDILGGSRGIVSQANGGGAITIDTTGGNIETSGRAIFAGGASAITITTANVTATEVSPSDPVPGEIAIAANGGLIRADVAIDTTAGSVISTGYGILTRQGAGGDLSISTGAVDSVRSAIEARHVGSGSIMIDTTGGAVSSSGPRIFGYGILVDAANAADVSITTGDVSGNRAIRARSGGGNIAVDTTLGSLTSTATSGFGLSAATSSSGTVDVSVGYVTAATYAIATAAGSGATSISVASGSNVTGAASRGISSVATGGSITITGNDATVSGFTDGVLASSGGGDITVGGFTSITGTSGDGLELTSDGGDIVADVDQVTGGGRGIITSSGTGATSIRLASTALVTGFGGAGIDARATGGAISVTGNSGDIIGTPDGIYSRNTGAGEIQIDNLDSVTGTAGDGLDLATEDGDITVNAVDTILGTGGNGIVALSNTGNISIQGSGTVGGITGTGASSTISLGGELFRNGTGIIASTSGDIDIGGTTAIGDVTSNDSRAIDARSSGGNITIDTSAGTVSGAETIISANSSSGPGSIDITTGDVISTATNPVTNISATANGGGITIDTTAGMLTSSGVGPVSAITANELGGGDITIASGAIDTDSIAVSALNDFGGNISIDTTAGPTTGGLIGVNARASTGSITIVTADVTADSPTVSATTPVAIWARSSGGDVSIDTTLGRVTSTFLGIDIDGSNGGALSLATGDVTAQLTAISVNAANGGGITIDTSTGIVSGGERGISATNNGSGALSITTGSVSGTSSDGIYARNAGSDLTISSTGDVSGGQDGIDAFNGGSGILSITTAGVTGSGRAGIIAGNNAGTTDLLIDSTGGNVFGERVGIDVINAGSGELSIMTAGVSSTRGNAINARNFGTDLIIDSTLGTAEGRANGIRALNDGSGALSITSGDVSSTSFEGIYARNAGTDLTINAADVSGGTTGIDAINAGSGALLITTGSVSGTSSDGIFASNAGSDLTISSTGAVSGGDNGINALNFGTGTLSLTATEVTGTGRYGIFALNFFSGTDLVIETTGAVSGQAMGIFANNDGSGDLSITTADVTGTVLDGIYARNFGGALTIDTGMGEVSGSDGLDNIGRRIAGIFADQFGSGPLSITAGVVSGGIGIDANSIDSDIAITLTSDAVITGLAETGIDARSLNGSVSVIGSSGVVVGATDGMYVRSGGGAILVQNIESVTGNAGDGLDLATISGDITVENVDTITGNDGNGILAVSDTGDISIQGSGLVGGINGTGSGDLTVGGTTFTGANGSGIAVYSLGSINLGGMTALGDITSANAFGIAAANGIGADSITIDTSAGTITSGREGIGVSNLGTTVSVTTGAINAGGTGIAVESDGGDVTVDSSAGTITAGFYGIVVNKAGTGATTITTAGVSGTAGGGIFARNIGTDLSIDASDDVSGGIRGINARNFGSGALTITTASVSGTTDEGIYAYGRGTDMTIDSSAGDVSGGTDGIFANNRGSGALSVTTAGVSGTAGVGINVGNNVGTTDLLIDSTAGDVVGARGGIVAFQTGTGSTSITTANVTGSAIVGIEALIGVPAADLSIDSTQGRVEGGQFGISALHFGTGALTIATGDVTGTSNVGIYAYSAASGSGLSIDSSTGSVTGGTFGIIANNGNNGASNIAVGNVTGGQVGLQSFAGTGATTITLASMAEVAGTTRNGIEAFSSGGQISVTGSSSTATGGTNGIYVRSNGGEVTAGGFVSVTGASAQGIDIFSDGGDITVDDIGSISGGDNGVIAVSFGGNVAVTNADSIEGEANGILIASAGGDIIVDTVGSVTANAGDGLDLISTGGEITVNAVDAISGEGGNAIRAFSSGGDIAVTDAGDIVGSANGLFMSSDGGAILIDDIDSVTGTSRDGIDIASFGGDITINAVDTISGDGAIGIRVASGAGDITITDSGLVGGIAGTGDFGIRAITGDGAITISGNGDISSGGIGLFALATSAGAITLDTTTGIVTGGTYGLFAQHDGAGGVSITAGDVTGGTTGIFADAGAGVLALSLTGDVTGGENGVVTVTQNGTALIIEQGLTISGGTIGIATMAQGGSVTSNDMLDIRGSVSGAIMTFEGDDFVILDDGATVDGAIMLGDGDDGFDYRGGTFGALRGGDGFDTLDFNSTGRVIDGSGAGTDAIAEFEVFNFNGGDFVLAGAHGGLVQTNFNAGDNVLLGSITSTNVTIAAAARLEVADGASVTGTLVNNGALGINAAGMGTFSVTGDFTQTATGTLTIDAMGEGVSDALVVTGAVDLAGTLELNRIRVVPETIRLIDGGTGLNGTFDTIAGLAPGGLLLSQAIEYDAVNFDVNLVTVVNDLADVTALDDPDDLSLAPVLTDGIMGGTLGAFGDAALAIALIDNSAELSNALTELRPEVADSGLEVFRSSQTAFFQSLQGNGTAERGQGTGAGGVDAEPSVAPKGKQLWGSIRYMNHDKSGTGANPDFNADRFELATGITGIRLGSITLDFAAGFANISTAQSGIAAPDASEIEVFRAGANASVDLNRSGVGLQARLDGTLALAAGSNDFDMSVAIPAAGFAGVQSGEADFTSIAAGLRLSLEGVGETEWPIKPFVSFAWENLDHDDVMIGSGASALDTTGGSFDRTVVGYGLELDQQFGTSTTLRASAQANHYLGDTRIGFVSRFVEGSNDASAFQTTGEEIKEQFRLELGLDQQLGNGWKFQIDGQAELGDLEGYGGTLTISKRF